MRRLVSLDMNTTAADYLQFYVQFGSKANEKCLPVDGRKENVLVQFSGNGGVTWSLLQELSGHDYAKPGSVLAVLFSRLKTNIDL